MKIYFKVLLLMITAMSLSNCSGDDSGTNNNNTGGTVSPSNPDQLASVLVIPNAEVIESADLPESSDPSVAPAVSHIDTNISYSAGTQMYIPCNVASPSQNNIAGVYIQVVGASTYFDVPINSGTSNGLISLPVDLPSIVGAGSFTLILKFYDTAGNIGLVTEINITVTAPSNCGTTKVSGGEGLTSNVFTIPAGMEGVIKITYDTYTVPDKIDVFQNGVWIGGTGPSTQRATLRKALNCNVATEAAGYKGEEGEFVFTYNPSYGNEIEVVVSGCEDGGTAWEYTFSCPQEPVIGEGTAIINGVSHYVTCTVNQASDMCPGEETTIFMSSSSGSDYYINIAISNMPPDSSGTFPIYDGESIDHCALMLSGSFGPDFPYTSIWSNPGDTGTITKTGSTSFTFEKTFTNIFTDEVHTISGSGTYQMP